jgi:hypothetical protein
VLGQGVAMALEAGERIRLGERHQVLVAVRLAQVLDVAHEVRVGAIERLAELERRFYAGLRVAVPARRRADVDAAQRVDVEPALRDAVGAEEIRGRVFQLGDAKPRIHRAAQIRRGHLGRADETGALGARLQRAQRAPRQFRRSQGLA